MIIEIHGNFNDNIDLPSDFEIERASYGITIRCNPEYTPEALANIVFNLCTRHTCAYLRNPADGRMYPLWSGYQEGKERRNISLTEIERIMREIRDHQRIFWRLYERTITRRSIS